MGCSAAKNLTVEPLNGSQNNGAVNRKVSIAHSSISDVPPLEGEDPQTELLENGTVNNILKGSSGMSFEIAFEEENSESIIKKHPPKKFQKLEEAQTIPVVSLVKLQEKLDEAEVRRQQILQQRIQSAKLRPTLKTLANVGSLTEDSDHLKVPPDIPHTTNPYDVSYV